MKEFTPIDLKMTPAEYVAVDAGKICGCGTCKSQAEKVIKEHPKIAPSASRLGLESAREDFKYWQRTLTAKRRTYERTRLKAS